MSEHNKLKEKHLGELEGRIALRPEGGPTHQFVMEFSPQRLHYWVETLFADY